MLQNTLLDSDLEKMLRPFLRLADVNTVIASLSEVIGTPIKSREDIVCQSKVLLTYKGYRIDIRDLRLIGKAFAVCIQFKAKQKWIHGLFGNQSKEIMDDLQRICKSEIADLHFARYVTTVPGDPMMGGGHVHLTFFHDSRALNRNWVEGRDVSPLLIAPDAHHGNCFVEFQLNPAGYFRDGSQTKLRGDWLNNVSLITEGIESDAKRMLGME
jgi:hypothetical protein